MVVINKYIGRQTVARLFAQNRTGMAQRAQCLHPPRQHEGRIPVHAELGGQLVQSERHGPKRDRRPPLGVRRKEFVPLPLEHHLGKPSQRRISEDHRGIFDTGLAATVAPSTILIRLSVPLPREVSTPVEISDRSFKGRIVLHSLLKQDACRIELWLLQEVGHHKLDHLDDFDHRFYAGAGRITRRWFCGRAFALRGCADPALAMMTRNASVPFCRVGFGFLLASFGHWHFPSLFH
jgi:hypothetical protein